jgi:hypothetical protein
MEKQPTCEEQINNEWEDRISQINESLENSEKMDEFLEGILAFTPKVTIRVELSTGGPADWIELEVSKGKYGYEIDGAVYHFADWFDHAEQRITGKELQAVESMFESYLECLEMP